MKSFTVSLILLLQLFAIPCIYADPLEGVIDESNKLPDGNNYANVSLSYIYDGAKRGIMIVVEANETILFPRANFGIEKFAFNTTIIEPEENLIVMPPPGWTVQFGNFNYSEFGRFHVNNKGGGNERVNPCIIEVYHITDDLSFADITVANNDSYIFTSHIAQFTFEDSYSNSAYFGSQGLPTSTTTTSVPVTTTTAPVTTTVPVTTTTTAPVTTTVPVTTTTTTPVTTTVPVTTTTTAPVTTTVPVTTTTTAPVTTTVPVTTTTTTPVTTTVPVTTTTTAPVTTTVPVTTTTTAPVTTTVPVTTTTTAPVTTTVPVTTTTTEPVTTTTTSPGEPDVTLTQETVFYSFLEDGGATVKKPICLDNPSDLVAGLQFDLCEYNAADEPVDCMECIDCELTERSTMFNCEVLELPNGCCRVLLLCMNPGCAINPGICNIATVVYTTLPISTECPGTDCTTHMLENSIISDYDGNQLTAEVLPGEVCPFVCGDVCPADDPLLDGWDCGDGMVDIYDIMCEVDLALTATAPDDCQHPRADLPTGTPPNCVAPDGAIDILDIMVVTDMALNRSDCCTFYYTGGIF